MSLSNQKILVIMPSLTSGGAERALINFLNELKAHYNNIDLLLFQQNGLFYDLVPSEINIVNTPIEMRLLYAPISDVIKYIKTDYLLSIRIILLRIWVKFVKRVIFNRTEMAKNQYVWKYYSKILNNYEDKYDVAIAYQQTHPINYLIDKVNSIKKIGWLHSSYKGNKFNKKYDLKYYEKLDIVYTVSEECLEDVKEVFYEGSINFKLMKNIVSKNSIIEMSVLNVTPVFNHAVFNIVTIGRLDYVKGYDLMLNAVKMLAKMNKIDFCLYIIGEGTLREWIEKFVVDNQLSNQIKLLGVQANPYAFINQSDLYIQTSRFEGYGLAIEEAKLLQKPLLLTDFTCAKIHVNHRENGIIVEHDPKDICNGILDIFNNYDSYRTHSKKIDLKLNEDNSLEQFINDIEGLSNE